MYSSINNEVTEVSALVERLRARKDLLPLKARGLRSFAVELNAISEVGLPWKAVWRILREVGYQGTYRQFVAMANRLTGKPNRTRTETKNLPVQTAEKHPQPAAASVANQGTGQNNKPEWQIRREEEMARLDRLAEENRPGMPSSVDRNFLSLRRSRVDVRNDRTFESQESCKCPDEVRDGTPEYAHDARTVCRS
jgi:hypothetical protein